MKTNDMPWNRVVEKRSERMEVRLTPANRQALERIALTKRRTLTSLIDEMIDKLIAENPE